MTQRTHLNRLLCGGLVAGLALTAASAQQLDILWTAEHGNHVNAVALAPDGSLVASGSRYTALGAASAKLWDGATGQLVDTFDVPVQDSILSVDISAPSRLLAVGRQYPDFFRGYALTTVYDVATHTQLSEFNGAHNMFSADGRLLASGGGHFVRSVYVNDVQTGVPVTNVNTGDYIWSLALAPDGAYFAAGSDDGLLRLWAVPGAEALQTFSNGTGEPMNAAAISPDGMLVAGGTDFVFGGGGTILIWNAQTGAPTRARMRSPSRRTAANCFPTATTASSRSGGCMTASCSPRMARRRKTCAMRATAPASSSPPARR